MLRVLRRARGASDAAEMRAACEVERAREDRAAQEAALEQGRRLEAQEKARKRRARMPARAEVDAVFARVLQAGPSTQEARFLRTTGDTSGPVARLEEVLANGFLPPHRSDLGPDGLRKVTVPFDSLAGVFWDAKWRGAAEARTWLARLVWLLRKARRASSITAEQARRAVQRRLPPSSVPGSPTRPNWTIPRVVPAVPVPTVTVTPKAPPEQPARADGIAAPPARTVGTGGTDTGEIRRDEAARQAVLRARKAAEEKAAERRRVADILDRSVAEMRRRVQPAQQMEAGRPVKLESAVQIGVPNKPGGSPPKVPETTLPRRTAPYTVAEADQLLRGSVVQIGRTGSHTGFLVPDPGHGERDPLRLDALLAKERVWAAHSRTLPGTGMEWLSYRVIDLAGVLAGLAPDMADRWIERLRKATDLTMARRTALAEAKAARDAKLGPAAAVSPRGRAGTGRGDMGR